MATVAVVQSPRSDFVELARTKQGKLFKKELLRVGRLADPRPGKEGQFLEIDDALLNKLVTNFDAGVCDIVQTPVVGDDNKHTEDPDRNIGEIVALECVGTSLYGTFDVRKEAYKDEVGKTLLGASAMFAPDYKDTRTGKQVGPTLLHVAYTNRPHALGLEPFRELVAASSDQSLDDLVEYTVPQEDPMPQTLEELLEKLKTEHKIDVTDLQAKVKATEDKKPDPQPSESDKVLAQLSALLAKSGVIKLSKEEEDKPDPAKILEAVTAVTLANETLGTRVGTLEDAAITAEVQELIRQGRILPAQKDAQIKLCKSNRELFDELVPAEAIVKLSQEVGVDGPIEVPIADDKLISEVDRLVSVATGKKG